MQTVFDGLTVLIFAGLVTLFLSRSMGESEEEDNMWHYLPPAAGLGVANWLGNEGYVWQAALLITAALAYAVRFLRRPAPPNH